MDIITLTNPFSNAQVSISNAEAVARLDDCLLTFGTADEQYQTEGLSGSAALQRIIDFSGADRAAQIWFS